MKGVDILARIVANPFQPYAVLYRPEYNGRGRLDVFVGTVCSVSSLAELPLPRGVPQEPRAYDALVLVPYRQLAERGFAVNDDGEPLQMMNITERGSITVDDVLQMIPDMQIEVERSGFETSDGYYAAMVRDVLDHEIATGEGSNFVVRRDFAARLQDREGRSPLVLLRRLLTQETGAYWTFAICTGDRCFVGATPERHVSLADGRAIMNPISGTYRYPVTGLTIPDIVDFLSDRKETDELTMVVDEELKMMGRICPEGGFVTGPHLREMARLAHTEYYIEGETELDVRTILRETLFAPTVTGSPLENACRVIARHEPGSRGYYGGVAALIGRQADGQQYMDSAILIRTAEIGMPRTIREGILKLGVGATLVRHSSPDSEASETHAKAAGIISALGIGSSPKAVKPPPRLQAASDPKVQKALEGRNATLSRFWFTPPAARQQPHATLKGLRALVIDAEDMFTSMLGHQLAAIGLGVEIARFDGSYCTAAYNLVVLGPGPGDPRDSSDPRVARLSLLTRHLLADGRPFFAVCLSHQILAANLGLDLVRRDVPNQGRQSEIDLFGSARTVGFYNSFVALSANDRIEHPSAGTVEVSRSSHTGEVYAMRGKRFGSAQFHIESILTQQGPELFAELLSQILTPVAMEAVS